MFCSRGNGHRPTASGIISEKTISKHSATKKKPVPAENLDRSSTDVGLKLEEET